MNNKHWDLAARYLHGKATASEQEELYRWMEEDPENKAQFQAQKELWRLTAPSTTPEIDSRTAWQKVKREIEVEKGVKTKKVFPMFPLALRVAASVAFLLGILLITRFFIFPYYGMEIIESGSGQLSFMLPDSSQVWLNRESKLVYDPDFEGSVREVYLEGEAFFDVKKNPQRTFLVRTKDTETRVVGTSFNLRAYPQEPTEELIVATGKVQFSSKENTSEIFVTPGSGAKLEKASHSVEQFSNSSNNAWAYKTGRLEFNGQSLQSILVDLERFYGVEMIMQNYAIADCRFTGSFEHAKLESLLRVLAATLQLQFHLKDENTYLISGQKCK